MDAKKRWQELETGLIALQSSLERDGEQVAAGVAARFRDTTKAVKDFLGEVDGVFELAAPVRKLMRAPATCTQDDSLSRSAQIMWDADCGAVPVVDGEGAVVGMITDRDVCMAAYTRGLPLEAMTVGSAMSKQVFSCTPEASIGQALRLMAEKQVRRLPVTENGKLVGVVSLADVARDIARQGGGRIPTSLVFADALASISAQKPAGDGAQRAAE
jgi:CBS domain-containing protein